MSHSCVENYIHIIFSTKNRRPLISLEMEDRLYSYLAGIAKKKGVVILKINGTEDHIHMLIKLHPSIALATMVKEFKSYSTGWMKKCGVEDFSWQEGYGAFSYSKSFLDRVIRYIENQKEHHKFVSFADELDKLKKLWGIAWDF